MFWIFGEYGLGSKRRWFFFSRFGVKKLTFRACFQHFNPFGTEISLMPKYFNSRFFFFSLENCLRIRPLWLLIEFETRVIMQFFFFYIMTVRYVCVRFKVKYRWTQTARWRLENNLNYITRRVWITQNYDKSSCVYAAIQGEWWEYFVKYYYY